MFDRSKDGVVRSPNRALLRRAGLLFLVPLAALAGFTLGGHSAAAPTAETRSEAQWLTEVGRREVAELGASEREDLLRALETSAAVRRAVLARYLDRADPQAAVAWRQLLATRPAPDIFAAALETAETTSGDRGARALELLSWLQPDARTFELARKLVDSTKDDSVLVAALATVRPLGLPTTAESREMVTRLSAFARHPVPLARAHAVQRLAEWDKTQTVSGARVLEALSDEAPIVRQAAVGAVMLGHLRSEELKSALVQVLADPREDMTTRAAAMQALETFALHDAEHAAYVKARNELERLAAEGGGHPRHD